MKLYRFQIGEYAHATLEPSITGARLRELAIAPPSARLLLEGRSSEIGDAELISLEDGPKRFSIASNETFSFYVYRRFETRDSARSGASIKAGAGMPAFWNLHLRDDAAPFDAIIGDGELVPLDGKAKVFYGDPPPIEY